MKKIKASQNRLTKAAIFLAISIISALLAGGFLGFYYLFAIECALSLGCTGQQTFPILIALLTYLGVLAFTVTMFHKKTKVSAVFLMLSIITGFGLLFLGFRGWNWLEDKKSLKERAKRNAQLLENYEKVTLDEVSYSIDESEMPNTVRFVLIAQLKIHAPIKAETVEALYKIVETPSFFLDEQGNECHFSKILGSDVFLLHYKNEYIGIFSKGLSKMLKPEESNMLSLRASYPFNNNARQNCARPDILRTVNARDFIITKTHKDELQ